jgi:hypothetical protein
MHFPSTRADILFFCAHYITTFLLTVHHYRRPGGLQLGHLLLKEERDYVIFEKVPCCIFAFDLVTIVLLLILPTRTRALSHALTHAHTRTCSHRHVKLRRRSCDSGCPCRCVHVVWLLPLLAPVNQCPPLPFCVAAPCFQLYSHLRQSTTSLTFLHACIEYHFLTKHHNNCLALQAPMAGSFFDKYPRQRKLISLNKRFTGRSEPEYNLRHDWNSLLDQPDIALMTNRTEDRWPSASLLASYLRE